MNKQRRASLDSILDRLGLTYSLLEEIKSQEEEAYDNLPAGLQESERGCRIEEVIDSLDSALQSIEEAQGYIEEAKE